MPADLWRFAEVFYRRPGVETACLQLQDQGADVCLLLCAIWLDQRGAACTPERAERLRATAAPWQHEVVGALRQVRQRWRAAAAHDGALTALREQVKRLELEAEREQLQRLATLASDWPAEAGREPHAWLNAMSATLAATGRDALDQLRVAALLP